MYYTFPGYFDRIFQQVARLGDVFAEGCTLLLPPLPRLSEMDVMSFLTGGGRWAGGCSLLLPRYFVFKLLQRYTPVRI